MGDRDTLGHTGRAGGVDDVGERVETRGTRHLTRGERTAVDLAHRLGEGVHIDRLDVARDVDARIRSSSIGRDDQSHTGIGDHVRDAIGGQRRVDGQVRRTQLRQGPLPDQTVDGASRREPHHVIDADPPTGHPPRETIRPLVELGVGERCAGAVGDRDGIGMRGRDVGEDLAQQSRLRRRRTVHRGEFGGCRRVEQGDRRGRPIRIVDGRPQDLAQCRTEHPHLVVGEGRREVLELQQQAIARR